MTPKRQAEIRREGISVDGCVTGVRPRIYVDDRYKTSEQAVEIINELSAQLAAALEHNNTMQRQDQRHMEGMEAKITELRAENAALKARVAAAPHHNLCEVFKKNHTEDDCNCWKAALKQGSDKL